MIKTPSRRTRKRSNPTGVRKRRRKLFIALGQQGYPQDMAAAEKQKIQQACINRTEYVFPPKQRRPSQPRSAQQSNRVATVSPLITCPRCNGRGTRRCECISGCHFCRYSGFGVCVICKGHGQIRRDRN